MLGLRRLLGREELLLCCEELDLFLLPKEPKNTLTSGAICETLLTIFCAFVTVVNIPSSPPIRSTKPLISVRFVSFDRFNPPNSPPPEGFG